MDDVRLQPLTAEQQKRRRGRSIAIALSLGALVVLFYAATMIRLGNNVAPQQPTAGSAETRPG